MSQKQISLDLSPDPDFSFLGFERGFSNQLAVTAVESFPNWPTPILMLCGPSGTGKTHLGHAWSKKNIAQILEGNALDNASNLPEGVPIFLDRAENADEAELFALFNLALNGHIPGLLLASRLTPPLWEVEIPDLKSRLNNVNLVTIDEHEDVLLEPIIRKLFDDQGRQVSKDIVSYMLKYCDRSVASLRDFILGLDQQARVTKSDVTKAYVAKFLQTYEG